MKFLIIVMKVEIFDENRVVNTRKPVGNPDLKMRKELKLLCSAFVKEKFVEYS